MKRRGRPRIDPADRSVAVSFALPSKRYDRLYQRALLLKRSVPDLVRTALLQQDTQKE